MKYYFVLLFILASQVSFAQCTITWENTREEGVNKRIIERLDSNNIIGIDGFDISRVFLDTFIRFLDSHPYNYLSYVPDAIKTTKNDSIINAYIDTLRIQFPEEAKLRSYKGREVAHILYRKYLIDNDTIVVHKFSYCEKEWGEDFPKLNILYSKKYGILKKNQGGGFDPSMMSDVYWFYNNNCLTPQENERVKKLVQILKETDL